MTYTIGSFNVRNLNYPLSKDGKSRDFDAIATIIKKEGFDVVALQEVLSDRVGEQLKKYLGKDWEFAWERPPQYFGESKADARGEGYAYIWNTKKLDLIEIELDGYTRKFLPRIWKQYRSQGQKLIREPYYARFTPQGKNGGCFCEIRLINTHIVYGDDSTLGKAVRCSEFLKLVSNVYENVANKRYGDRMPAYVVVLGDYNLSLKTLQTKDIKVKIGDSISERQEERVITEQGELTTLNHKQQDDGTYTSEFVNDYDHFSFLERYKEIMGVDIERVNIKKYYSNLVEYWDAVSDHVPIKMSININKRRI